MPQDQSLARVTAIAAARARAWPWASSHPFQLDDMDEVGSLYIPQDVNAAFLSSLVVTYRKKSGFPIFILWRIDKVAGGIKIAGGRGYSWASRFEKFAESCWTLHVVSFLIGGIECF